MSRADRRRLKRVASKAVKRALDDKPGTLAHPAPASVALIGGPMDGWVVKPNAPVLQPTWCLSWPASVATKHAPGQYLPDGPGRARWVPL